MASKNATQIFRSLSNFKAKYQTIDTQCHINRKYIVDSRRNYATKLATKTEQPCNDSCPSKTCKKEKKKSFWGMFGGEKKEPTPEICSDKCKPEPDLSRFGGKVFSTCGSAYVIQKDMAPSQPCDEYVEALALKKIEADFMHKHRVSDPMPNFTTAEQRMIDLCINKLHPFYRRYANFPTKQWLDKKHEYTFSKQRNPNFNPHEIPAQLLMNRDLLEKKNLYINYKRVEPPKYDDDKKVKTKTLNKIWCKVPVIPTDSKDLPKRRTVFDSLYQPETKF